MFQKNWSIASIFLLFLTTTIACNNQIKPGEYVQQYGVLQHTIVLKSDSSVTHFYVRDTFQQYEAKWTVRQDTVYFYNETGKIFKAFIFKRNKLFEIHKYKPRPYKRSKKEGNRWVKIRK